MANYYDLGQQKSLRKRHKLRRVALVLLLLCLILAAAVAAYFYLEKKAAKPVVIKPFTSTVYNGSPKHVIQNDVFSFESTEAWQFSPEKSAKNSKYVYFTQDNNLIVYELTILFNKSLDGQPVNYVMPVTVSNNQMKSQLLSPRCGDKIVQQAGNSLPPNTLAMQYGGTSYLCLVRGSGEKAAAALVGGGYDIPLKTAAGQAVTIEVTFVNDGSSYFGQVFQGVLDSFKFK